MAGGSRGYQRGVLRDYGNLLQKDYNDYLANGVPSENEILEIAKGDEKGASALRAMSLSDKAFDNAALGTNQQLARYGIRLNDQQRQGKGREYAMAKLLARVNSANNTRVAESERQEQARDMALNLGSDLYASSLSKMGYAAQGAVADIQLQQQQHAARKSQVMGMASQALGAGAMLMVASDENLKTNIRENNTGASLKNIMAMRTKKFQYKPEAGQAPGDHTGILHQEAPDSIRAEADGVKGVNVGDWVGELTGAVQELGKQTSEIRQGLRQIKGKKHG